MEDQHTIKFILPGVKEGEMIAVAIDADFGRQSQNFWFQSQHIEFELSIWTSGFGFYS